MIELKKQLNRVITGEFAFLSGESKLKTTQKLLEYAKAKNTSDQTRRVFYQCYKELTGFKQAVRNLNAPSLAANVLGDTIAGPLKVKTMTKKYRKMQKMNQKFLKAEATGRALPAILQEVLHQEEIEAAAEAKEEVKAVKKVVAVLPAKERKRKEPEKMSRVAQLLMRPESKKAKKQEQGDVVLEIATDEPKHEKKVKTKEQKRKPKKHEEKKKVKFDLSANTTKSKNC